MMKNVLFIFLTAILLFISGGVNAQNQEKKDEKPVKKVLPAKVELRGRLLSSSDGEMLIGAYVYGKDKDTPIALTDSLGWFKISCFKDSLITLSFSYMGFMPLTKRYIPRSTFNAGIIKMSPDVMAIDEVVVSTRPPFVTQKNDTTEFNAAALKMADDADLENLLKKLPGFTIENGKIMAQGEEVKKLYIDGKTYFLNNPSEALKNLPASLVSKVKMFDDSSEEAKFSGYEDGKKHRALNITTKNPNAMKVFGNTNGEYGIAEDIKNTFNDNKYNLGFSTNLFDLKRRITVRGNMSSSDQANTLEGAKYIGKGGKNESKSTSINYSSELSKKVEFTGNYSLNSSKSYSADASRQDYYPSDNYQSRIYDSENHRWGNNLGHNINMQIDYKISDKDKITFSPSLTFNNSNNRSISLVNTEEDGKTLNNSYQKNRNESDNMSLNGRLSWMHSFKKRGRTLTASADFSQILSDGTQMQNIDEKFLDKDNILNDTLRNKQNLNNSDNFNINFGATYSEPISKKSRVSLNYNFENVFDESGKESISFEDEEFEKIIGIDTALTQDLIVRKLRHKIGLNYNFNEKDKFTFRGGASMSSTKMENEYSFLGREDSLINYKYIDVAPRADLDIKIAKNKNFNINYSGGTSSPSAYDLEDILDVSDPLQVSKGNPDLKKTFQHGVGLRYSGTNSEKGTYMSASLGVNQTFNNIATNMQFIKGDTIVNGYELQRGTRLSEKINLNGGWRMDARINFSLPLKALKLVLNPSLEYRYSHTPSIYDNIKTFNDTQSGSVSLSISSNISNNFDIYLSSNSRYENSKNTQTGKTTLFSENINLNLRWVFWKGFLLGGNMTYNYENKTRETSSARSSSILNVDFGKKFGSKKQIELKFRATDILRQRNTENFYLSDHYSTTSYRTNTDTYYTVSLSYRLMQVAGTSGMGGRGRRPSGRQMPIGKY